MNKFPILLLVLLLANCNRADELFGDGETVKQYAEQRGLYVGAAYNYWVAKYESDGEQYENLFAQEFNALTDYSTLEMEEILSAPDEYYFDPADYICAYCSDNGMVMTGQHLVWHGGIAEWVETNITTGNQAVQFLQSYISNVVIHYRNEYPGIIRWWSVVNEAISHSAPYSYRDTIWYDLIGPDYIELAFRWAHEANPDAKLYYNDYGIETPGPKTDYVFSMLSNLIADGVPVHGVGLQCHFSLSDEMDITNDLSAVIRNFAGLGLEVYITELDILINDDSDGKSADKLNRQAEWFRQVTEVCINEPACKIMMMWGLTDKYSYVNHADWLDQDEDWPHIFDESLQPKPAYYAIRNELKSP